MSTTLSLPPPSAPVVTFALMPLSKCLVFVQISTRSDGLIAGERRSPPVRGRQGESERRSEPFSHLTDVRHAVQTHHLQSSALFDPMVHPQTSSGDRSGGSVAAMSTGEAEMSVSITNVVCNFRLPMHIDLRKVANASCNVIVMGNVSG